MEVTGVQHVDAAYNGKVALEQSSHRFIHAGLGQERRQERRNAPIDNSSSNKSKGEKVNRRVLERFAETPARSSLLWLFSILYGLGFHSLGKLFSNECIRLAEADEIGTATENQRQGSDDPESTLEVHEGPKPGHQSRIA